MKYGCLSINICNPGHNTLELYILVQVCFTKVKWNLISSIKNSLYKLPHPIPHDLRFKFSGNQETLEKSQICMETYAQSPFHLRARSLLVSDMRSETSLPVRLRLILMCRGKISSVIARLMSKCEAGESGSEELKKCHPLSPAVL